MQYRSIIVLVAGILTTGKQASAHGWHEEVVEIAGHFSVHLLQIGVGIVGAIVALSVGFALWKQKAKSDGFRNEEK